VDVTAVRRYVAQFERTGLLARKPILGCPRRIGREHEAIPRARWEAARDASMLEHCASQRAEGGWHAIIALRNLVVLCLTALALQLRSQVDLRRVVVADIRPLQERPTIDADCESDRPASRDNASPGALAAGVGGEP
jgi:hypothetical protein